MREVRLRFSKENQAKYISHLDINRAMGRAFKRANIPLWYTEGYNPHAHMSFSLPLSLGVESLCESVDIRLISEIPNKEIKDRMNEALPSGIRIMDVCDDYHDCSEIAFSDYVYIMEFDDNEIAMIKIKEALEGNEILALKKGKSGKKRVMIETDIKQFIDKYSISIRGGTVVLNVRLAAGPSKNLNPVLLFDTLMLLGKLDFNYRSIRRIRLMDKDFNEFN